MRIKINRWIGIQKLPEDLYELYARAKTLVIASFVNVDYLAYRKTMKSHLYPGEGGQIPRDERVESVKEYVLGVF
jgi:hypothetical protein